MIKAGELPYQHSQSIQKAIEHAVKIAQAADDAVEFEFNGRAYVAYPTAQAAAYAQFTSRMGYGK